jgi:hypothetical protein
MSQKGFIYKLISNETPDVYIGSTSQKYLSSRFASHRRKYKDWQLGKYNYVSSFELIKYPDCRIELLEVFMYNDKHELRTKEGEYQKVGNFVINKLRAGGKKNEIKISMNIIEHGKPKEEIHKGTTPISNC